MTGATGGRKVRVISTTTMAASLAMGAAFTLFGFLNSQTYAGTLSDSASSAVYVFGTALAVLPAIIMLAVAFSIGVRQSVGRQWLLLALGAVSFATGDVVWTVIELVLGQDPYPSLADLFYPLQYVFFLAAIVIAVRSYRGFVDIKRPMILGTGLAVASAALVYVTLLRPYVFEAGASELGWAGLIVSTLYPLADVALMLAPAVTLALVIGQLGSGRFAWPWWIVIAGALVFSVTDSAYSYTDWAGIGTTVLLDLGWIAGLMLFAIASLVARDVYRS